MCPEMCEPGLSTGLPTLYLALELSQKEWQLGFTVGLGQAPRLRKIAARDLAGLAEEMRLSQARFGLPETTPVLSCYEAGRDGFWVHRALTTLGVTNLVVDAASIEVNRRYRRVKTDRLDVTKLVTMLLRYAQGEKKVWSVLHPPSPEEEDQRHLHRELMTLKRERTRHVNRLKGLLASQGVVLEVREDFLAQVETVRDWADQPLPPYLRQRLAREYERWGFVQTQIRTLNRARQAALRNAETPAMTQIRQLLRLRGVGINSAWVYVMEFFAWRHFRNRRELAALAGLTPTPYQSGGSGREQGISKAGNRPVRAMAIELAWAWLRFQPQSALSQWYQTRFGHGNSRIRRIGIVALARKLLIALWRYLEEGVLPEGAQLQAA